MRLTPRSDDFRRYVEWIDLQLPPDKQRIAEVVIRESASDYTQLIFGREQRNAQLPPALFAGTGNGPVPLPPLPDPCAISACPHTLPLDAAGADPCAPAAPATQEAPSP